MGIDSKIACKAKKLDTPNEVFSEIEINKNLNIENLSFEIYDTVSSTNTIARQKAQNNADEGTVIIAAAQTEGRGRLGRRFFSPFGSGIYMSVILRPQIDVSQVGLITTCAAVAVSRAIDKITDKNSQIKWVNDIYIDDKKVCGILNEAVLDSKTSKAEYVVLGIGINVFSPENGFPDDIKDIAAAVCDKQVAQHQNRLIAEILNIFFGYYKKLTEKEFYDEYKKRMFLIGRNITVLSEPEYNAKVLDIDEDFRLVVKKQDGEVIYLNSGEVSTRLN